MIYVFPGTDSASVIFDGDTLTEEQKEKSVIVSSLPKLKIPKGKQAILKADKETNKIWWEYIENLQSIEFEEIKLQIEGLQQALAEVTLMMMGGGNNGI